ncbi:Fe2+-dependent dioxygenase [Ottowia sp.]|uniref:Fe2+-dependent dioxygenase n=1 Tax=Ottowia sp. TaxID=1898956 RepID=UPI003A8B81F4
MLLTLPQLLAPEEVAHIRARLLAPEAIWHDGARSAGSQAVTFKHNQQLAQNCPVLPELQALVLDALGRDPLVFSAALPKKIFNPLFNRYSDSGQHYGAHIDGAVLHSQRPDQWVRTDLSCTVFLAEPDSYDGGELVIQDTLGTQSIKLAAGDAVLYPGNRLHEVTPVTRGERLASFFWIESMVRSEEQRHLLFDMDMALLKLRQRHGESDETLRLSDTYHRLLRLWADT